MTHEFVHEDNELHDEIDINNISDTSIHSEADSERIE